MKPPNAWELAGRSALAALARAAGVKPVAISSTPRALADDEALVERPRRPVLDASGRFARGDRPGNLDRDRTPEELDEDGLDEPAADIDPYSGGPRVDPYG